MPDLADLAPKRKRVSKACETCRARKSKCDSKRPICGRCEGYGFQCLWGADKRQDNSRVPSQQGLYPKLELVRELCSSMPEDAKAAIDDVLAQLKGDATQGDGQQKNARKPPTSEAMFIDQPHTSRYLGEGGDSQFLGQVNDTSKARDSGALDMVGETLQIENQERVLHSLPQPHDSWGSSEKYLLAYFSSIHVAYPFLPQSYCMSKFKNSLSQPDSEGKLAGAWLALFYSVLALGRLYVSLSDQDEEEGQPSKHQHDTYFQLSVSLTNLSRLEASAVQVSVLLVQSFYLLAISKTDSCWITLGVAIRLAQTLGLHANFAGGTRSWSYPLPVSQRTEIRRRVWYSLYVLDRLLALQVGRPPAISDTGFSAMLPSNLNDAEHDWEVDNPIATQSKPSEGDYFLQVIGLSKLIGLVEAHLNEPPKVVGAAFARLNHLDCELSDWKNSLPRYLRFDIIQVFEKSRHFQRQRNMLAMKYHQLRTLMYRQYLDFPATTRVATEILTEDQMMQARVYGEMCVSEARQIARLFHGIQDQSKLISDYPWWQLVSCVTCAASILIVAQVYQPNNGQSTQSSDLVDDATTCLEILGALSTRSRAAQCARDILVKLLSQYSSHASRTNVEALSQGSASCQPLSARQYELPVDLGAGSYTPGDNMSFHWPPDQNADVIFGTQSPWNGESFEPILWSTQLLDLMSMTVFNPDPSSSLSVSDLVDQSEEIA